MLLNVVLSLLGMVITILLVLGIHESAHFMVARLFGIKVLRFSIGFGKALYSWHDRQGTEYVLAAIPLGGYVQMLDENEATVPEAEKHLAFNQRPLYQRVLVVLAGPFSNLILAGFLYWLIFAVGFTTLVPILEKVDNHSIASRAGLRAGEEIVSIDQHETLSWPGISMRLITHYGDEDSVPIGIKNKESKQIENRSLDLKGWKMDSLRPDPLTSLGLIPLMPKAKPPPELIRKIKYPFFAAGAKAFQEVRDLTYINTVLFGKILELKMSLGSLGGPITIFQTAGFAFENGALPFLSFLAFFNVAIGVINFFPIPGLDGGHLLFQAIECILRRPLSMRVQVIFYRFGFIFLIFIMAQALANDLMRMFS